MIFEQFYLDCLSQASYLIGDPTSGRAVVVDPRRDVSVYTESAAQHGLAIELVIETHFHADFLSGHLEMAEATGAVIAYGSEAETEFPVRMLLDGERIQVGSVGLEIRHTPGHTPESICIVVYKHGFEAPPYAVLTGDTLFVGDVGRPDLMSSVGMTAEDGARQLYDSLHTKLLNLPDATRVYPGHGAGSACGKNLSSDTWSTIGDQRLTNPSLASMTPNDFVAMVTGGLSAPPNYFAHDAKLNRQIRELLDEEAEVPAVDAAQISVHQRAGANLLDVRAPDVFAQAHVPGSINVGSAGRFAEFSGGILDSSQEIILVVPAAEAKLTRNRLARIGYDNVVGYFDPASNPALLTASVPRVQAAEVEAILAEDDVQFLDVRQPGETEGGTIAGAATIPLTRLNERLSELDPSRPTLLYCASGFRSMIAASRLLNAGFSDVTDLVGGYGAWQSALEGAQ